MAVAAEPTILPETNALPLPADPSNGEPPRERSVFANMPFMRLWLAQAVSQTANRAKGDQDPSTWKPKVTGTWCEYAADWIAVKSHWELSVTTAEKAALTDMLESC